MGNSGSHGKREGILDDDFNSANGDDDSSIGMQTEQGGLEPRKGHSDRLSIPLITKDEKPSVVVPSHEKKASRQRRRLSVTPQMVGSIKDLLDDPEERERALNPNDVDPVDERPEDFRAAWRYVAVTKKGFVPYNRDKQNQDTYICHDCLNNDPDIQLYGVCDGHGQHGHHVSQYVKDYLPRWLAKQDNLKTDPEAAIATAVENLCRSLKGTAINTSFSGTTLVFALCINDRLYCANVGDSRCVVGASRGDGKTQAVDLSFDHKPENPEEKQRILGKGGRVHTLPGPPGEDCGPHRVWLKDMDVPGLAMSRSIGDDVGHTVGVIHIPEIHVHDLSENDTFMVLASDGVWEFISSQEGIDLIAKYLDNSLKRAATQLVGKAVKLWKREEEVIDDITAVIIKFPRQDCTAAVLEE